jgi:hypothetical protein
MRKAPLKAVNGGGNRTPVNTLFTCHTGSQAGKKIRRSGWKNEVIETEDFKDIIGRKTAALKSKKWDKASAIKTFLQLDPPTPFAEWEAAGHWLALNGPEPYKSKALKIFRIHAAAQFKLVDRQL